MQTSQLIVKPEAAQLASYGDVFESILSNSNESNASQAVRFRIIANIMGFDSQTAGQEIDYETIDIQSLPGGMHFALVGDVVLIIPGRLKTAIDEQLILTGFEQILDLYRFKYKWLLDCSGIENFSGLMFGNLIYYQNKLNSNGKGLFLHWLKTGVLSDSRLSVLKKLTNLIQIGSIYFSTELIESPSFSSETE